MSQRRIGPGERADGVLIFQRPSFKQSNETLLLQMADSGAVDRPALAPIGFESAVFDRKEPNRMSPELNKTEGDHDAAETDVTRRINRGAAEQPDAGEPEEKKTPFSSLREAYVRARDGRRTPRPEAQARTAKP